MLRKIFSAIIARLRSIGRLCGHAAAAPFRLIDGLMGVGSDATPMPAVSSEVDDIPAAAKAEDDKRMYEQVALSVMQWAVDSLASDRQAPMPPKMPRKLAAWLPGLSREELITLACADRMAVSAHIRSYELVHGVRSVRPLDHVEWPPEPGLAPDQGSGGFLSVLAAEGTAPWPTAAAVL